ncbi:hypothetical protein ACET3Z_014176 [Daucus carota]
MDYFLLTPDFFKLLTSDDCASNELPVPAKFCDMHAQNLSANWILSIRNGYKIRVVFDAENRKLVGVGDFFSDFGLVGGEVLIFESVDFEVFKVYIVGEDCSEIQYPAIVHRSQDTSPVTVSSNDGGWKFVQFISVAHPTVDTVEPPTSFMSMFGSDIPEWFVYNLKNFALYGGHYEFLERKLSGLRKVCEGLRLLNFDVLELMVFTYDGGRRFKLSLFDGCNVEIDLDVNDILPGSLRFRCRYPLHFKVNVHPSDMLRYCHGVTVPVEFNRVTAQWKKKDRIHVFKGALKWEFDIRKRRTGNRTSIHGGWIKFCQDLQINVGDECYFRWIDESFHHFRVEILKAAVPEN